MDPESGNSCPPEGYLRNGRSFLYDPLTKKSTEVVPSFEETDLLIPDDRKLVSENMLKEFPYNTIGLLVSFFKGAKFTGTAFLISPNLIVTATHNCFHG